MRATQTAASTIAIRRLYNQAIAGAARRTPADVVTWLGAVQAQEYGPATWGIALRMKAGTALDEIERAIDAGRILRTHVLRPTWHFVPRDDLQWMLALTAPRVRARMAPYNRRLEIDARTVVRASAVFERALGDGAYLTRAELAQHLARSGLQASGQRLAHIMLFVELDGVICSGPRRGKQFTYALLALRAPRSRELTRDEALGTLASRFLRSHGPATASDFVWWSGLLTGDARRSFEIARARPETVDGLTYWSVQQSARDAARDHAVHLLPVYDEYVVAYRDRRAVPHGPASVRRMAGRPLAFQHPLIINGQVAGVWRPGATGGRLDVAPFAPLRSRDREALHEAAARYAVSVGSPLTVTIR
ncbi:MAG TPA: winged helix DNA-binding domain-containing protein [Gemmatimonadaceae bacterium]